MEKAIKTCPRFYFNQGALSNQVLICTRQFINDKTKTPFLEQITLNDAFMLEAINIATLLAQNIRVKRQLFQTKLI